MHKDVPHSSVKAAHRKVVKLMLSGDDFRYIDEQMAAIVIDFEEENVYPEFLLDLFGEPLKDGRLGRGLNLIFDADRGQS